MTKHAPHDVEALYVQQVSLRNEDPDAWDAQASLAGASLRSAHAHLSALDLKHLFRGTCKTYEVLATRPEGLVRVGHYTLIEHAGSREFYDGLCLPPEYQHLWPRALRAALHIGGPGAYVYGWEWSLEPPRQGQLGLLEGAMVRSVVPITVNAVDFSRWPDWNSYSLAVSENVRRNSRKASVQFPRLKIDFAFGLDALGLALPLTRLRRAMYRRKGLPFNSWKIAASYLASFTTVPRQAQVGFAAEDGRVQAIFRHVEFGPHTYYLDGATAAGSGGAGWRLMLTLLGRAFARAPEGKLLLGYVYDSTRERLPDGLMRSRRSLRHSDWPTSIVAFDWRA